MPVAGQARASNHDQRRARDLRPARPADCSQGVKLSRPSHHMCNEDASHVTAFGVSRVSFAWRLPELVSPTSCSGLHIMHHRCTNAMSVPELDKLLQARRHHHAASVLVHHTVVTTAHILVLQAANRTLGDKVAQLEDNVRQAAAVRLSFHRSVTIFSWTRLGSLQSPRLPPECSFATHCLLLQLRQQAGNPSLVHRRGVE